MTARFICLMMVLLATVAVPRTYASDQDGIGLRFEQGFQPGKPLHFRDSDTLQPADGDFELVEYALMSNEAGERWALVTVRNQADGSRLLKREHLVATFADGHRRYAQDLNERVEGGAFYTQAIFFGAYKFPIIAIEVR